MAANLDAETIWTSYACASGVPTFSIKQIVCFRILRQNIYLALNKVFLFRLWKRSCDSTELRSWVWSNQLSLKIQLIGRYRQMPQGHSTPSLTPLLLFTMVSLLTAVVSKLTLLRLICITNTSLEIGVTFPELSVTAQKQLTPIEATKLSKLISSNFL